MVKSCTARHNIGFANFNCRGDLSSGSTRFNDWDVGDSIVKGPPVDASKLRFVSGGFTESAAGVGRLQAPAACFVAVRGTLGTVSSLLDAAFWLVDFDQEQCPGCQVDFGFRDSYASIKEEVFETLDEFGCKELPLHLVGHSQGAAIMTYLLYDALSEGYRVPFAYALESPRPGNEAFARALQAKLTSDSNAWRVSHFQDIVPHLPPKGLLGYEHALKEVYYTARTGTSYQLCNVEDDKCSNRWWPWELTGADHSWYADLNPCSCSNSTSSVVRRADSPLI